MSRLLCLTGENYREKCTIDFFHQSKFPCRIYNKKKKWRSWSQFTFTQQIRGLMEQWGWYWTPDRGGGGRATGLVSCHLNNNSSADFTDISKAVSLNRFKRTTRKFLANFSSENRHTTTAVCDDTYIVIKRRQRLRIWQSETTRT